MSHRSKLTSSRLARLLLGLTLAAAAPSARAVHTVRAPNATPPPVDDAGPVWMEMRNVRLHVDASAVMRVVELRGQAVPTTPGARVVLDDPRSFAIEVSAGHIALDGEAIAALMNEIVFAYRDAPIRRMRVRVVDSSLVQSGIVRKGVDIPFTMTSTVSLAPDQRLRIHATSLRLFGVDGKRLLGALGLSLEKMLDLRNAKGVAADGNDLLLDPLLVMPPPTVRGRVEQVRVGDGALRIDFSRTDADSVFGTAVRPDTSTPNFVYFRGGTLRFGRLEMHDTDLLITDANAADPFDLYLAHYAEQLSAGWSRTMPDAALRVVMPDWSVVAAAAR